MPHNACRIRNDPKDYKDIIPYLGKKSKKASKYLEKATLQGF